MMMDNSSWQLDPRDPIAAVTPLARIRWAEHRFRVIDADEDRFHLLCSDGSGTRRELDRDQVEHLIKTEAIVIEHGHFNADGTVAKDTTYGRMLASYPVKKQARALEDLEWVVALDADHLAGKVMLYRDSRAVLPNGAVPLNVWIDANLAEIRKRCRWIRRIADPSTPKEPRKGQPTNDLDPPKVTQLKQNLAKYRRPGFNVVEFVDRYDNCIRGGRRLPYDVQDAMQEVVNELFARKTRFTPAEVRKHIAAELSLRAKKKVKGPCHEALARYISGLDQARLVLARFGFKRARELHGSNAKGPIYTRVGEMILIDSWKVDLVNLLKATGIWLHMTRRQKAEWGARRRVWLCVAIDSATRVILGMAFGLSETAALNRRVLRMIVSDKSDEAVATGCVAPPIPPIGIEGLHHDTGTGLSHGYFQSAALSISDRVIAGIVNKPWRHGIIERFHRTPKEKLLPYFSGLTFGNHKAKGDFDAMADASATLDVFGDATFRFINDIYHLEQHRGLDGQPPANRFQETLAATGMKDPPTSDQLRVAFGLELQLPLTSQGFTFLGIEYKAVWLAKLFAKHARLEPFRVKVDALDLGRISVFSDGTWQTVDGPPEFLGVGLTAWKRSRHELARRYGEQASINFLIVAEALRTLKVWGARERLEAKIIDMTYDNETLVKEANGLLLRVLYRPTPAQHAAPRGISQGAFGDGFPTGGEGVADVAGEPGIMFEVDPNLPPETVEHPLDDPDPHSTTTFSLDDVEAVVTPGEPDAPLSRPKTNIRPTAEMTSLSALKKKLRGE